MAEETKKDAVEETTTEEAVEVPKKFAKLITEIETMSVLDLSELVKVLEKKFGVSAQAVAAAAPATSGAPEGGEEEKDSFDVELTAAGDQKIQVIKVIKEALGLGLKDAKDMMDGAPVMVKAGLKKEEAEELKGKFEAAGGTVTLK